ncbi:ABC transporter permease [Pontibacter sp. KCTC 32443]|uniref:ABC transporter permease n=1 Tax=Pontibacter TaxID=323449 RepID=UPI00164E297C|nr:MULTISPECIES: ABC transporter permease [Pontibacter]MBC5774941.1 ABC transporter permease [Pontibacter sp. KCTC 32443]
MKVLWQDILYLWRSIWVLRLAMLYLAGLTLLIVALPILPLAYTPNHMDLGNTFLKPFTSQLHWLGTDQLGRDVLVNILYGARNGLLIAIPVMLISSLLGTTIGAVAGYFGNYKLQLKRSSFLVILCSVFVAIYYLLYLPLQVSGRDLPTSVTYTSVGMGAIIILSFWLLLRPLLSQLSFFQKQLTFPIDSFILRTIELVTSLPKLLILISVSAFAPPSVLLLSIIFICTYWTVTARLARAEMLRIRQLPYMEAAVSIGMKPRRIIINEGIPNMISPIVVAFIFGTSGLLAIESTLSFLGIGLPATFPSWGRTIAGIRSNLSAWWLVAFPGGLLSITVLALQICSYYLVRITQERQRS